MDKRSLLCSVIFGCILCFLAIPGEIIIFLILLNALLLFLSMIFLLFKKIRKSVFFKYQLLTCLSLTIFSVFLIFSEVKKQNARKYDTLLTELAFSLEDYYLKHGNYPKVKGTYKLIAIVPINTNKYSIDSIYYKINKDNKSYILKEIVNGKTVSVYDSKTKIETIIEE